MNSVGVAARLSCESDLRPTIDSPPSSELDCCPMIVTVGFRAISSRLDEAD